MTMTRRADYRLALRPDDDGVLDDVVVNDVSCFRFEMMGNDTAWMSCVLAGEEPDKQVSFWLRAKKGRLEVTVTEYPRGVVYEDDSQGP